MITETELEGLLILEPTVFKDERGFFCETFNQEQFNIATKTDYQFVQDNHSRSAKGVLRGLHYQLPPKAQGKLVRVVRGKAWDVAVDIRKNSLTFGKWFGTELSELNHKQLWIPPGFAHGYLALTKIVDFSYKTTDYYSPQHQKAIAWNDINIKIDWPLLNEERLISEKDKIALALEDAVVF